MLALQCRPSKTSIGPHLIQRALARHASSTPSHTSLSTFLAHARRINLAETSTVYIGTRYEYTAQAALRRLGLALARTGGTGDKGIDLLGTWRLPVRATGAGEFRWADRAVFAQCKALSRKASPNLARELEGAFAGLPAGARAEAPAEAPAGNAEGVEDISGNVYGHVVRGSSVMGLLVVPRAATEGIRSAIARSRYPMGFVMLGLDGRIEQCLWNSKANQWGLEGMGVQVRHFTESTAGEENVQQAEQGDEAQPRKEVFLTFDGDIWEWPHGRDDTGSDG